MKNRIDTSRKSTPWCEEQSTIVEKFITEKYQNTYSNKHPKLIETNEAKIINAVIIDKCRICESEKIKKNGKTNNNIQRYKCFNCHKTFTPLTNTIFENHKISISEWIEFLLTLFNYGSTSLISKVNKNAVNTASYWLHKTFKILETWQDNVILENKVYLDEMFYKVIKSDIEYKNGKQLRGLSHNQYCIGIAYDGHNIRCIVEGLGKTSTAKTNKAFMNNIKCGSTLIHDDEKSHLNLLQKLNLKNEEYKSTWLKNLDDKDNPLRPVNHQCDLIRQFLNTHSGFNRDDLQDFLNLYCFMNSEPHDKLKKVDMFIEMALNTTLQLKYRELFNQKINENN